MLTIPGQEQRNCDGISRRNVLKIGALSVGAGELTLADLLRAEAQVGSTTRLGESAKDRPVHFQERFATLYHHPGINPASATIIDPAGRSTWSNAR